MAEQSQDHIVRDFTSYQMTLMAIVFPWRIHAVFNVVAALGFALVGAPLLALCWGVRVLSVQRLLVSGSME